MKRLLVLAVLGLALLAGPAQANGFGSGQFNLGINFWGNWGLGPLGGGGGAPGGVVGPWYLYWPYEAHFQTPALPQYPYWPGPQTLPNGGTLATPGMLRPATPPPYWY